MKRARKGEKIAWQHEHASAALFRRVVDREGLLDGVFGAHGLVEQDVKFVQELIFGAPGDAPPGWVWAGRGADKAFLYEIVANHRNGIDVDKFDYFRRDARAPASRRGFREVAAPRWTRPRMDYPGVLRPSPPAQVPFKHTRLIRLRQINHARARDPRPGRRVDRRVVRRADLPKNGRGDAAAATWIFRGDTSRAP